ncbi:hypothetical protein [Nocardioides ungokensis]|uniref:hypothetical protein n=1 Tax=Nocardioides ungokensis TaxID=1643322 RepID=UPI003CCD6207
MRCSSGTYIRAIARDLGARLGVGGHLTALRRTAVGPYDLAAAHTLEELAEELTLMPIARPHAGLPLPRPRRGPRRRRARGSGPRPRGRRGHRGSSRPRASSSPSTSPGGVARAVAVFV